MMGLQLWGQIWSPNLKVEAGFGLGRALTIAVHVGLYSYNIYADPKGRVSGRVQLTIRWGLHFCFVFMMIVSGGGGRQEFPFWLESWVLSWLCCLGFVWGCFSCEGGEQNSDCHTKHSMWRGSPSQDRTKLLDCGTRETRRSPSFKIDMYADNHSSNFFLVRS